MNPIRCTQTCPLICAYHIHAYIYTHTYIYIHIYIVAVCNTTAAPAHLRVRSQKGWRNASDGLSRLLGSSCSARSSKSTSMATCGGYNGERFIYVYPQRRLIFHEYTGHTYTYTHTHTHTYIYIYIYIASRPAWQPAEGTKGNDQGMRLYTHTLMYVCTHRDGSYITSAIATR